MALRNVHKDELKVIGLPEDAISEDRGLRNCGAPQLVLASLTDAAYYKNDRTSLAYKFDEMTVELEKDGVTIPAPGVAITFPYQSDAVGFCIDWRQVTDDGVLMQGCYRVKVTWSLDGNEGFFYYGSFNLLEYSVFNAQGTVRLFVVLNDLVRKQGINFKDSGFATTIRFIGTFGNMQPNYDIENINYTDRTKRKVRIEALRTYELTSSMLLYCMTRQLDEEILLAANQIYVTDHNADNHRQDFFDFPVILSEDESPSIEYTGTIYAKVKAVFNDKVQVSESKYDGNIQGSDNVVLSLPTVVSTTAPCAPVDVFVGEANIGSFPSGTDVFVTVTQDGFEAIPEDVIVTGNDINIVLADTPDTTIEVNGTTEGTFTAGSTIDVQLSDSGGVVTPTSVTVVGNDVQVLLPDAPVTGWVRPTDWLAIPSTTTGEQVFYGLFAVQNVTFGNFVAFSFAGNYTVDWGDGSALENVNSGVTAKHQYDWANVSDVTSEGFRQALIKVTPQAGQNLTNINLQRAHSTIGNGKASQFIDMVMSLPNVTGANQTIGNGTFVFHRRCQRVWIKEIGAITTGTSMFFSFTSLQNLPLFDTSNMTLMNSMFNGCASITEIPFLDTSSCTSMNAMFNGCISLESIPLLDTLEVTDMASMFNGCASLKTVPLLDTSLTTSMTSMFSGCASLQYLPLLNTASVTGMNTMFLSCTALESIPAFNTASVTSMVNMFNACNTIRVVGLNMAAVTATTTMFGGTTGSLQKLTATGLTRGISVANNQMSAAELDNFFTSLGTASGAQTITVTGNHGAATCTTSIATGKGFTVVI